MLIISLGCRMTGSSLIKFTLNYEVITCSKEGRGQSDRNAQVLDEFVNSTKALFQEHDKR